MKMHGPPEQSKYFLHYKQAKGGRERESNIKANYLHVKAQQKHKIFVIYNYISYYMHQ